KGVFISPADRSPIFVTLSPGSGFLVNILVSPHDTVRRTEDLPRRLESRLKQPLEGIVAEVPVSRINTPAPTPYLTISPRFPLVIGVLVTVRAVFRPSG